jgi:hypothetical protein
MISIYWMHIALASALSLPAAIWRGLLFWPRLYYCLFNSNAKGRSIWNIITDPEDASSNSIKLKNAPSLGSIRPLWSKFLVFSGYQVHGAYAHLHQHTNEEVADAIADAARSSLPTIWDPLRLVVPYQYLSAMLFEPPDCYIGRWLTFFTIILVYLVPLCRGAAYIMYIRLFRSPSKARPHKGKRCRHRRLALVTANVNLRGHSTVTFETDGIPFIVDNSATCIIANDRSLFVGNLTPVQVKVETVEATQVR